MANAEHLEILKAGVDAWNKWRQGTPKAAPDLEGADLHNSNLKGINFTGTNLDHAHLRSVTLTNADLHYASLFRADLRDARLKNANLIGADLCRADLHRADLTGADLREAKLYRANFCNAYLSRADLRESDLISADFSFANLYCSDFSMAEIGSTIFGHTDLSTCKGLKMVIVKGSCTIDYQTLKASQNIPKSFLLKIGLPELYIDNLPTFFSNTSTRYFPVFLSHSSTNKDFARKLYEELIVKGINVFFDEKKMKPGDDIYKSISGGIDDYDKMILVCSKDSLKSWWVDRELDRILKKERNLYKEEGEHIDLLIPIAIDDSVYTWDGPKAEEVQRYVIGDFRNWHSNTEFEKALNALIQALNVDRLEIKPPTYIKKRVD